MNEVLLQKVTSKISEDAELRSLLDYFTEMTATQELLLSHYLDEKLSYDSAKELKAYELSEPQLIRIESAIATGQAAQEAEAIIWLEDNGFIGALTLDNLDDNEKGHVYARIKSRIVHILKVNDELGIEKNKIFDYLKITKDVHEFKIWRSYYSWGRSRDNFIDESDRIIVVGYRMFCQYVPEYLLAIMDLPSLAKTMGCGINVGSYIDYVVLMAEASITPQTIFDLFGKIRDLSVPGKDALTYLQAFGNMANKVIQYWIQHPYEILDGFGRPRDLKRDDYSNFIFCATHSIYAAKYVIEATFKDDSVWTSIMKTFHSLCNVTRSTEIHERLFQWLYVTVPKTPVTKMPGLASKIIKLGSDYAIAFIMEAELHNKKELTSVLCGMGIEEALKSMYTTELGIDLYDVVFHSNRDTNISQNIHKHEVSVIARNILNKCQDKEKMRIFLSDELRRLTISQYQLLNKLCDAGLNPTVESAKNIAKMSDEQVAKTEAALESLNNQYWQKVVALMANSSSLFSSLFTVKEVKYLLGANASHAVVAAFSYFLEHNARNKSDDQTKVFYANRDDLNDYSEDYRVKRLIELGATDTKLFYLCIRNRYVNDDIVRLWTRNRNKKTPVAALMQQTGWFGGDGHFWTYNHENCIALKAVIKKHKDQIPLALKAIGLNIDFDRVIKIAISETLSEESITKILLAKAGISTN